MISLGRGGAGTRVDRFRAEAVLRPAQLGLAFVLPRSGLVLSQVLPPCYFHQLLDQELHNQFYLAANTKRGAPILLLIDHEERLLLIDVRSRISGAPREIGLLPEAETCSAL